MSIFGKLFKRREIIKGPFLLISIGTENIRGFLFEILVLDELKRDFRVKIIKSETVRRNKDYSGGNAVFDISDLEWAIRKLKLQFKSSLNLVKDIILGIGSNLARLELTFLKYKRENPYKKIDRAELKYIIHKVQWEAFEDIRGKFADQKWNGDDEIKIIGSEIQDIEIDGYKVLNPIKFEGKEILFSISNVYIPRKNWQILNNIFERLKIPISFVYYLPSALSKAINQKHLTNEAIVVNIGGEFTDVVLFKKNRIENVSLFGIGGNSFTRRLQRELGVGFWEAEDIKQKYSEGRLSESVTDKITEIFNADMRIWKNALKLVLEEFPRISIFPSIIFLAGGGSKLMRFKELIENSEWLEKLPFFENVEIKFLYPNDVLSIENDYGLNDQSITDNVSAIEVFALELFSQESELKILLRKITNMMQE